MAVGIAGCFKNKYLGATLDVPTICLSFISGVIFFGSYAPQECPPIILFLAVNGLL